MSVTKNHHTSVGPRKGVLRPVHELQRYIRQEQIAELRKGLQAWIDVIVSADSQDRGDFGQSFEHFRLADIACVENRVDAGKDLHELGVEKAVGIGDDAGKQ
jgi:hypothetical protein